MANPNNFLAQYEQYKKQLIDNTGILTIEARQKQYIAETTLSSMIYLSVKNAMDRDGFFKVIDKTFTFMQESGAYSTALKETLIGSVRSLPEGNLKNKVNKAISQYGQGETAFNLYTAIKTAVEEENNSPEAQNYMRDLAERSYTDFFRLSPVNSMPVFEKISEKIPFTADIVPEEIEYKTFFDKEPYHPVKTKINELIALENEKEEPDLKYIAALNDSNRLITSIEKDSIVPKIAEDMGKVSYELIGIDYKPFTESHHVDNFNSSTILSLSNGEIGEYYHKNILGSYNPSPIFREKMLAMIDYARQHHLVKTPEEAKSSKGSTRLNYAIDDKTKALKEAIEAGNSEEIKKCYAEAKEAENNIDFVIANLKSIDPQHFYNENLSDARIEFYPAKYRIDIEGSTLFNQMAYISDMCSRYDIEPKEVFDHPADVLDKILDTKFSKESPLAKYFQVDNPFSLALKKDNFCFTEEYNGLNNATNDIIQLSGCLTPNNPEHRLECYHYMSLTCDCKRFAYNNNKTNIEDGLSNRRFYSEVLPTMIMTGKDFDPLHMINGGDVMVDIKRLQPIPRFNLKEYLKKHQAVMWESMFDKLKKATLQAENLNNNRVYERSRNAIEVAGKAVKDAILETYHVREETVDRFVNEAIGKEPMTPIQRNTAVSEMAFAETMKVGFNKEGAKNAISEIAYLKKNYDKHNFLAKIFYKNLRDQSSVIESMKDKLVSLGVDRKGLDKAIYNINHNQEEKGYTFAKRYAEEEYDLEDMRIPLDLKDDFKINKEIENDFIPEKAIQKEEINTGMREKD